MHQKLWLTLVVVAVSFYGAHAAAAEIVGSRVPEMRVDKILQAPPSANLKNGLKGKLVILEFWATWCAPCVAAIPHLNALADRAPAGKVIFVAVTDEPEERVLRFLAKRKISAWIALDRDRSVSKSFNIHGLPTTVVIAPSGYVAMVTMPDRLTDEEIQRLLRGRRSGALVQPSSGEPRRSSSIAPQPILQIELAPSEGHQESYWFDLKNGILSGQAVSVQSLFGIANEISATRVIGPSSILQQWVSVKLKVPPNRDLRSVMRDALATAFSVRTKREARDIPVYRLRIGPSGAFGIRASNPKDSGHLSTDIGVILGLNWDISALPAELENVLGVPVIDETNLSGKYDWDLSFAAGRPGDIKTAIHDQLGLDLVESRATVEVLVVEAN